MLFKFMDQGDYFSLSENSISPLMSMNTFLSLSWLTFLIVALGALFAGAWLWALLFFGISCILLFAFGLTPEGKRLSKETEEKNKQKQLEAERVKKQEKLADQELINRFSALTENPDDSESLNFILNALSTYEESRIEPLFNEIVVPLLQLKPKDNNVQKVVFESAKKSTPLVGIKGAERAS